MILEKAIEIMEANRFCRGRWLGASKQVRSETGVRGTEPSDAYEMGKKKILAGPNQEVTCEFCIQGAIYAAAGQCGVPQYEARLVIQHLDSESVKRGREPYASIMYLNDTTRGAHSKDKMIKILKEGLE